MYKKRNILKFWWPPRGNKQICRIVFMSFKIWKDETDCGVFLRADICVKCGGDYNESTKHLKT